MESRASIVKYTNKLTGGIADNKDPLGFDMKSLLKGMSIEREHTKDINIMISLRSLLFGKDLINNLYNRRRKC